MHSLSIRLVPVFLSFVSRGAAISSLTSREIVAGTCGQETLPQDYRVWPNSFPDQYPWENYESLSELCLGPSDSPAWPNFKCCSGNNGEVNCQVPPQWANDPLRANELKQKCERCNCKEPSEPEDEDPALASWDETTFASIVQGLEQQKKPGISCDQNLNVCRSNLECQPPVPTPGCNSMACGAFGRKPTLPNGRPRHRRPQVFGRCAPRDYLAFIRKTGGGGGGMGGGFGGSLLGKREFDSEEIVFTGGCHCNATYIHENCCSAPDGTV